MELAPGIITAAVALPMERMLEPMEAPSPAIVPTIARETTEGLGKTERTDVITVADKEELGAAPAPPAGGPDTALLEPATPPNIPVVRRLIGSP